jgi:hypothetical protein
MLFALVSCLAQSTQEPRAFSFPKITQTGVGPLRLGEAIPASLLAADKKPASLYRWTYFGEGAPLDGFYFPDVPVLVVLKDSPFSEWGEKHVPHKPPASVRNKTISLALDGKLKISMIVVTDSRLQTESEVFVGQSFSKVRAAYPNAKFTLFEGIWEEPSCILFDGNLEFFFTGCKSNHPVQTSSQDPNGRLLRIVVTSYPLREEYYPLQKD